MGTTVIGTMRVFETAGYRDCKRGLLSQGSMSNDDVVLNRSNYLGAEDGK